MQSQQIVNQIENVLKELDRARTASQNDDLSGGLPRDELMKIRIRFMACIERLAPTGSVYLEKAKKVSGWDGAVIVALGGILRALKNDFEDGYILTLEELVHSAVFDDFLEMSSELLKKGYKDPAAVVAGSVLEEHVRKLSIKNGIQILDSAGKNKKFDVLIIELVKSQKMSESQRKILVGWYGQRSEAAHGNYANVIENEVNRMISGIRDFMVRFPA